MKSRIAVLLVTILGWNMPAAAQHRAPHGPVFVPLDSWIYPALQRLAAMGFAPDAESLVLPWTREQCAMLTDEAADFASRHSVKTESRGSVEEALRLIAQLKKEFPPGAVKSTIQPESVYSRYLANTGTPLQDTYHFGQTIVNDFGRPASHGSSLLEGFSGYATLGRFSAYFRGEYQQATATPPFSQSVQQFISATDQTPPGPSGATPAIHRFDPVEAYIGVKVGLFDVTAGKQSLWWGPGEVSAFHFSNNAEPLLGLRISQAAPIVLPGPLKILGRIRTQFLVAGLAGHRYPAHPLINAQKITFQLTPNLEIGFTRSAIFGGATHPLTAGTVSASLFSVSGGTHDPGDRRSGFDFRWHVPLLRRYLTLYSDSLADDEPSPLDSPRRSAWAPGFYLSQLPHLRHLDFRVETYSTWLYQKDAGGGFIYWNTNYRDAYTNRGNLLGSWVGRDARLYAATGTYWLSAHNKIALSYRQKKTGSQFVPGGGTQTDASLTVTRELFPGLESTFNAQYERYFFPILGAPQRDLSLQLTFIYRPTVRAR